MRIRGGGSSFEFFNYQSYRFETRSVAVRFRLIPNKRHCAYSQSLLAEQKHDGVDEVSRYPMITYHLVHVNDWAGCHRTRRIPQHELERILQRLFSAFLHYLVPRQRVQLVQRYVVHRNHVGPAYKTRKPVNRATKSTVVRTLYAFECTNMSRPPTSHQFGFSDLFTFRQNRTSVIFSKYGADLGVTNPFFGYIYLAVFKLIFYQSINT